MMVCNSICSLGARVITSATYTLKPDENNNSWASQISKITLVSGAIILIIGAAFSSVNLIAFGATIIVPSALCLLVAKVAAHYLVVSEEEKAKLDESCRNNRIALSALEQSVSELEEIAEKRPVIEVEEIEGNLEEKKKILDDLINELKMCNDPERKREIAGLIRETKIFDKQGQED